MFDKARALFALCYFVEYGKGWNTLQADPLKALARMFLGESAATTHSNYLHRARVFPSGPVMQVNSDRQLPDVVDVGSFEADPEHLPEAMDWDELSRRVDQMDFDYLQEDFPDWEEEDDGDRSPPAIAWANTTAQYFWDDARTEKVANAADWPIIHIPGMLSGSALEKALELCRKAEAVGREILQFDEEGESVIRRSRVVNLWKWAHLEGDEGLEWSESDADTLREMVLAAMPKEILQGTAASRLHPLEDVTLVFYNHQLDRENGLVHGNSDFYDCHHDSELPGNDSPLRAFTLLLYLKSPEGEIENGGTRFPRLLRPGTEEPLTFRLPAGDALLWPNFCRNGSFDFTPEHSALPIRPVADMSKDGLSSEKVVLNMWFLGRELGTD